MPIHVAILQPPFDRMILDGTKRIESRFTVGAREPFGCAVPGQTVWFKRSGGTFFAVAQIARVLMVDQVTPTVMDEIAERYNPWICAPAAYWKTKRKTTRYATLMWLRNVRPTTSGPSYKKQNMRAWYVLDDAAAPSSAEPTAPAFEITLTAGMVRQNQVRVTSVMGQLPAACIGGARRDEQGRLLKLHLDEGPTLETDVVGNRKMFRTRAWGKWFKAQRLSGGDGLAFYSVGRGAYRVVPNRRPRR